MYDLEGMPPQFDEIDRIYLWGMQVYGQSPANSCPLLPDLANMGTNRGGMIFLAKAEQIFQRYGDMFRPLGNVWKTYLRVHQAAMGIWTGRRRVKDNLLDLLPITRDSVVLPIPSFSLKVIEKYVGFKRTQEEYGGEWSMAMFIEATETSDEAKRQELMGEILKYNREDLAATWAVFQWLKSKGHRPAR